jgi:hypothetical protein
MLVGHEKAVSVEAVDPHEGLVIGWQAEELQGEHTDGTEEPILIHQSKHLFVGFNQQSPLQLVH